MVVCLGCSPIVRVNSITPRGCIESPINPYKEVLQGFRCQMFSPIFSKAGRYKMYTELPLSTKTRCTLMLARWTVNTRGSLWGKCTPRVSSLVKVIESFSPLKLFGGRCSKLKTQCGGLRRASLAYLSRPFLESPPNPGPPKMVLTSPCTSGATSRARGGDTPSSGLWFSLRTYLPKCPLRMSSSISTFKWLHFTVVWPISL